MFYYVTVGDRTVEVDLTGPQPRVDGSIVSAELSNIPGTPMRHLLADGRSYPLIAKRGERRGRWTVELGGEHFAAEAVDERTRAIREMTGSAEAQTENTVVAPMPGLVVRLDTAAGEEVSEGQAVVVIEAMKMENELRAPAAGTVTRVAVEPGQTVDKGAILLVIE